MKTVLYLLLACFIYVCAVVSAHAQTAVDPAYANMQRAMGGIISDATASRGYNATDPRTYSTLRAIGVSAASGAATAGAGLLIAGTAPAWGTVLAVAAVGGAVSYGVSVGLDSAVKWAFGSNASTPITVTNSGGLSSGGVIAGSNCYQINGNYCSSTPQEAVTQLVLATTVFTDITTMNLTPTPPGTAYNNGQRYSATISGHRSDQNPSNVYSNYSTYYVNFAPAPITCPPGFVSVSGACVTSQLNKYTHQAGGTQVVNLTNAIAALTAAQKQQAVSYEAMALMINENWKKAAAQPGYAGVPYSVTSPVTAQQVQKWAQSNQSAYPTVNELTLPVSNSPTGFTPSTTTSPTTPVNPATSTTSPTSTNSSTQPETNLGPDPNITAPMLEPTPTAQMILSPLLSLMPDLKAYTVPGHTGACPTPTFDVFGKSILMNQHCTLFEQQRAALYTAGLLAFMLAAAFIVLSA
jgi:hypothetical protein